MTSPGLTTPDPIDRTRFPIEEWGLTETRYDTANLGQRETVFAVGNGYLGLRGNYEEGDADAHAHGCFLNGFHETWPIRHAEAAYGFAKVGQTIINVPDTKTIALSVDGEALHLATATLESFRRSIDFREGVLRRDLVWRTSSGKRVEVSSSRMVSFTRRSVAVMTYAVTVDADAVVSLRSEVRNRQDATHVAAEGADFDPRTAAEFDHRVLIPQSHDQVDARVSSSYRAATSQLGLAVVADHQFGGPASTVVTFGGDADLAWRTYTADATAGETITLVTWVGYADCDPEGDVSQLVRSAEADVAAARQSGVASLEAEQKAWLADYWASADVQVDAQPELQQAIRWCLFELAQAAGRVDGGGIAAKGVSASGYEGHYFWDTEVYLVPFLAHTNPQLARQALRFRIAMLDKARQRAREMSQRGALFPWRTINGEEGSAYYPAGTAQYHIDADVAWALCKYADVNADPGFLSGEALPVLVETARLYADLGFFRGPEKSFHLHRVTGPDEYSAVVNNNLYTNVMAKANLQRAAEVVRRLAADDPDAYASMAHELGLLEVEIAEWEAAAAGMTLTFDDDFGVHPQDADFLKLKVWDLANTPHSQHPLLLHYHPLVIYRHQVLKQADAVLALFMAGDEFTPEQKRADFEYYDPITTGDSTLSAVVQSIMAAEIGYQDRALEAFMDGIFVDLADLHHNTKDGVHIASAGGVWNALVYGFGGLRDHRGSITLDPRLPKTWSGLRFGFQLNGSHVRAELTASELVLTLVEGDGGTLTVRGVDVVLAGSDPVRVPLDGQGPELPTIVGRLPLIHGRPATPDEITVALPVF